MNKPVITSGDAKDQYYALTASLQTEIENRLKELGRTFIFSNKNPILLDNDTRPLFIKIKGDRLCLKVSQSGGSDFILAVDNLSTYDFIMLLQEIELSSKQLPVGTDVIVPDATITDMWDHEFEGRIIAYKEQNIVTVEDGEGDCFDVELERLEESEG